MGVAGDPLALAAHHQGELGVGLEPDHAIGDVDADVLQALRPFDVALLVEAGLQLDQGDHLLARLGRLDQGSHDRAVARGAVESHLDRKHPGITGSAVDERLDRGGERVVRVMNEEVALPDDLEQVDLLAGGYRQDGLASPR